MGNFQINEKIDDFIDNNDHLKSNYIFKYDRSGKLSVVKRNSIGTYLGRLFSYWTGNSYHLEAIRNKFIDQTINKSEQKIVQALNNRITSYNNRHSTKINLILINNLKIEKNSDPAPVSDLIINQDPDPIPDSISQDPTLDPITDMEFEKGEKTILINGIKFSADNLARYMFTNKSDNIFIRSDSTQIIIWNNPREYLNILNQLLTLVKVKDSQLIKEIQLRIEGYSLAKTLINDFDNMHPTFSFSNLLQCLYQKMKFDGGLGSGFIDVKQSAGFDAYHRLRSCLPEKIMKVIFPFYAYNPGDPLCIRSASRVLDKQIERLNLLGLNKACTISDKEALEHDVETYIRWFEEKLIVPSAEDISWIGHVNSVKARQGVYDLIIDVNLRYVSLEDTSDTLDYFTVALMEKFNRNPTVFSSVQSDLSNILTGALPTNEKRKAIKNILQSLILNHSNLEVLKEMCTSNRSVFQDIRKAVIPDEEYSHNPPKNEVIWKKIEENPAVARSLLSEQNPNLVSFLIQKNLGIEIPLSACSQEYGKIFFKGIGDFPQVMKDKRDNQFKLLLSAI